MPRADPWLIAQLSLLFLSYVFVIEVCHFNNVLATMLSWEFSMLIIGQIYFWLSGEFVCDVASSDWSTDVSKASWHSSVLLGQLVWSPHFLLCCPSSWMLSDFLFAFILVELRNKWILAFWIIICPFSTQKCQCSAVILASVLEIMDSGLFIMLRIYKFLTDCLCTVYEFRLILLLFRNVHSVSGF